MNVVYGQTAMFLIRNYGTLAVTNGTVQNVNVMSYALDPSNFTYVGETGGVFRFNSVPSFSPSLNFEYKLTNVTFDRLYGNRGSAIYFGIEDTVFLFQNNSIVLENLTIKNSVSYLGGIISLQEGRQHVTIKDSLFQSNTGVT